MMSLRMSLFLDERSALLQPGDCFGEGFAFTAIVGRLRLGHPLAHLKACETDPAFPNGQYTL